MLFLSNISRHPGSIREYKSLIITYPESEDARVLLTHLPILTLNLSGSYERIDIIHLR
jgi:hypothetical protein